MKYSHQSLFIELSIYGKSTQEQSAIIEILKKLGKTSALTQHIQQTLDRGTAEFDITLTANVDNISIKHTQKEIAKWNREVRNILKDNNVEIVYETQVRVSKQYS